MTINPFVKHIHVHVKPGTESAFIKATLVKDAESLHEKGVTGFDLLQRPDMPTSFILSQSFVSKEAETAHRATAHYDVWRKATDDLVTDPRITMSYIQH
ncbi:MAG: putative quinol monooxygenase [Propionibacteriaceae bacterium]